MSESLTKAPETLDELLQAMKPKRRALLMAMPEHCWNVTQAGLAVGYAESYARDRLPVLIRRDVLFCRAQQLLMEEVRRKTWSIEGWRRQVERHQAIARNKGDLATVHAYDVDIGKHIGAYEKDNRQQSDRIGIIVR